MTSNSLACGPRLTIRWRGGCNPAVFMMGLPRVPSQRDDRFRRRARLAVALTAILLLPDAAVAQRSETFVAPDADLATRNQLERLVTHAESLSATPGLSSSERSQLDSIVQCASHRLRSGDFEGGALVAIWVQDQPALTDTFAIRPGSRLHLPNLDDLDLTGVLRSELSGRIKAHIAQFLRDPVLRVTPLIRLSVLGAVAHPGYYAVSSDLPASELIMRAGGPTPDGDLGKVKLRRGGRELTTAAPIGPAIATGATIDQLTLRTGDEVVIGERPPRVGALSLLQVVTGLVGVAVAFVAMQNSRHR